MLLFCFLFPTPQRVFRVAMVIPQGKKLSFQGKRRKSACVFGMLLLLYSPFNPGIEHHNASHKDVYQVLSRKI